MNRCVLNPAPFPMLLAALAGGVGLMAHSARGQTLSWVNVAGGSAGTAGNWNPAQLPGAANPLVWNLASTYPVTFPVGVASSLAHTYKRGVITLTMGGTHTVGTGGITVGDVAGDVATAALTTGRMNSAGPVIIGDAVGASGTLNVNDNDADLVLTSAASLTVGNNGSGTLNVTAGGLVVVADRLIAGSNASSVSTVVVSGQLGNAPFTRSALEVGGTGDSRIGAGGDATLLVDSGASAEFAGSLTVANGSASTSTITVEDIGFFASRLSVAGVLNLGRNVSAGVAAGNGSLIVNAVGNVNIGSVINLGNDPDGGTGLLRLTGARSQVSCGGLNIGSGGTLDLQDGELSVVAGTMTVPGGAGFSLLGSSGVGTPILALRNGATLSHGPGVHVGLTGTMELRVESGSVVRTTPNAVTVGVDSGSVGTMVVTGAGSRSEHVTARIGSSGLGTLTIDEGGAVVCSSVLEAGAIGSGEGRLRVLNGTLSTGGNLVLAGRASGGGAIGGGDGSLEIGAAGVVDIGGGLLGMGSSTVTINGGTLSAVGGVSARFTLNGGTINAASFNSGTAMNARGVINAKVQSALAITATGGLALGDGSADGFDRTPVNAGAFRVTFNDSAVAVLGNTTVNGGVLAASHRFRVPSDKQLEGTGTIVGDLVNEGDLIATGPAGLTFLNRLENPGGGRLSGTKLTFDSTASFVGVASGGGKWLARPGSTLVFTDHSGGITFVGLVEPDGFVCDGVLDVFGEVGIGDSDGFDLGPRCTLHGGTVAAFNGGFSPLGTIFVNRSGGVPDRVEGTGALAGGVVINIGVIAPGLPAGDRTGTIEMNANYVQGSGQNSGTLEFEIEGPAADQADKVVIERAATMDGTVRLRVLNGFQPVSGFRRVLLEAESVAGGIVNVDLPPRWSLERTATTIAAVFCPPDFNGDGFVDFFDYDDYVGCFESGACPPGVSADFNGDGFVDFFDYDDFVLAFENGC
ncbi:MAG: hypothetical protein HEQ23_12160 [Tepidisphaera sp.]